MFTQQHNLLKHFQRQHSNDHVHMYKVTLSLVTIRALNKNPIDDVTVNNDSMRTYDMWASFQVSQWCKLTDTMTMSMRKEKTGWQIMRHV